VKHPSAKYLAIVRILCDLGEHFAVADLQGNAITFNGHRFLRTIFKTRNGKRVPLYYCRCREIAVRDEITEEFVGLRPCGSSRQIGICALAKFT
jgi:hypothetical protein